MPWVISFIAAWILFFALVDLNKLNTYIYGGLMSLVLGSIVDYGGQRLGLYSFYHIIIPWFTCSSFYKFGPIFTMGIVFSQYVPRDKRLQVLNIFITSILYAFMEISIISTGAAEYKHWSIFASFIIDIFAFTSLTWVTVTFLRNEK
ncbi:MAG: CBO0543 family protein [Caulobacteraceae bacterium]